MSADPFHGDVLKLEGDVSRYRRRVFSVSISLRTGKTD